MFVIEVLVTLPRYGVYGCLHATAVICLLIFLFTTNHVLMFGLMELPV